MDSQYTQGLSCFSPCSAWGCADIVETAREQIDRQIQHLQYNIHALRARRNGLAPVHRLPVELLSEVFIINALDAGIVLGDADNLLWAKVSHVCRYWRSVALQTPRMWTRITVKSEPWVAMLLERSRTLPLEAHLDLPSRRYDPRMQGFALLAQNMSLLRSFTLSYADLRATLHRVWSQLQLPAPQLESFVVLNPTHLKGTIANGATTHIPTTMFGGQTPSLRAVALRQCTWCWSSTLFCSTVTHLVLDGRGIRMRPSADELLGALERMPMLESVDLDHVTPDVPWDFNPRIYEEPPAHLPHLRYLHINALALNCANIVFNLVFPANTQIVLCCRPFRRYDELRAVGSALATVYRSPDDAMPTDLFLRSFTFAAISPKTLQLNGWTDALSIEELRQPPCGASLQLNLEWDGLNPDHSVTTLLHACRGLPLTAVRTLYVPDYLCLTSEAWLEVFGGMRGLHALWVSGRPANHLPNALCEEICCECQTDVDYPLYMTAGDVSHQCVPFLFPSLQVLALEEVNFGGGSDCHGSLFWQLQDFVMQRRKHQDKLKISLYRCRNFIPEQVYDLKTFGAEVTWSGELLLDFDPNELDSDDSEEDYEDYYDELGSEYDDDISEDSEDE